jgi:hypothetical protein
MWPVFYSAGRQKSRRRLTRSLQIAMIFEMAKTRSRLRSLARQHFIDPLDSGKFVEPADARMGDENDPSARSSIHEYVQEL